jgi:hypothetical protein
MVKPPTRGRATKVLDGVSGGASAAYSGAVDDLLLFNDVLIYLNNQHATETVDYLIQATADARDTTNAEWETIKSQASLGAATSIIITHADIADLDAPWDAIRIGYVQTDGNNQGTLYAWICRK